MGYVYKVYVPNMPLKHLLLEEKLKEDTPKKKSQTRSNFNLIL